MERVTKAKVLGAQDGKAGPLITCGVRFMAWGEETGGTVSIVEHPIPPRALAAPLHRHTREDEYSYVVEGRVGAWADGEVVYGEPGDLIFKPRNQWHTFWNDGDEPARLIEVISPAGFEHFFDETGRHAPRARRPPRPRGPRRARGALRPGVRHGGHRAHPRRVRPAPRPAARRGCAA